MSFQSKTILFGIADSITIPQQVEDFKYPLYSPAVNTYRTDPIQYTTLFNQGQIGISLEADLGLTIAQKQKFTIKEISPDWGYATAATKVNPLFDTWIFMVTCYIEVYFIHVFFPYFSGTSYVGILTVYCYSCYFNVLMCNTLYYCYSILLRFVRSIAAISS